MTPNGLVDFHAHLCDPVFDADRRQVIRRARQAGVEVIVMVGENLADAHKNLELAREFPGVLLVSMGLYPTVLDPAQATLIEQMARQQRDRLAAIGEVGLDYWKVKEETDRQVQRLIFKSMIGLAKELELFLNVHSRSAARHAVEFLLKNDAKRVLMHAFDGRAAAALPAVEAGYFFSIPPSIVRSRQKQKLVRRLPLECLVLETDSPVLGSEPQERNEPANAVVSLEAIAAIKDLPIEQVIEVIRENSRRLLGCD